MMLGMLAYMSPEQARGAPADHRADSFAFGCVLYEMVSGLRAFRRNTPVESMNAVLGDEPPNWTASSAKIPPALERVVRRCLEKQPDNRFQTAKDFAFAIENTSSVSQEKGRLVVSPSENTRQTTRWLVAGIGLAGVLPLALSSVNSALSAGEPGGGRRYLTYSGRDLFNRIMSRPTLWA